MVDVSHFIFVDKQQKSDKFILCDVQILLTQGNKRHN